MSPSNTTPTQPHPPNPTPPAVPPVIAVDPPPAGTAPTPPAGFDPKAHTGLRKLAHPRKAQVDAAAAAAQELLGDSKYTERFGANAPPAQDLADALTHGVAWRRERDAANNWRRYCVAEDALAWQLALGDLESFKAAVDFARSRDPGFDQVYPNLAKLYDTTRAIARKGVATKHKKARNAAKAQPASPAAPAPGVPSPASPAGEVVTVTASPAANKPS